MSEFNVEVVRVKAIEAIPDADAIESVVINGYRSIAQKGAYKSGDLVVYIPEDSVVPVEILRRIGLEGKLTGKNKDRVKAIKLRGVLSQGILYPIAAEVPEPPTSGASESSLMDISGIHHIVSEGQNVADLLGITKYEPILPASMSGDVYYAGRELTVSFDIENIKKYDTVLNDGEEVVFTEKLHGTFMGIGILPESHHDPKHIFGKYVVFSKGLGSQGLCLKLTPKSEATVYIRAAVDNGLFDALETLASLIDEENEEYGFDRPLFILGEVFGGNVQDNGWYSDTLSFRMFDAVSGFNHAGLQTYFDYDAMVNLANIVSLDTVPLLYRGPFSQEVLKEYTEGKETVSGDERNIREGLVARPIKERTEYNLGRVLLKSVSEAYLTRKNGTEYR